MAARTAPHRGWTAAGAALALLSPACNRPPTAETAVQAELKSVRAEQTPDKLLARGRAFAAVRDYTRAEQYLSAALAAGAKPDVVLPLLLRVCVEEGRFRVALIYAEPQLNSHPDDYRLRFVVASLYRNIGETETALEHLQLVADSHPDHAEVQYAMAVLYRDSEHDVTRADAHFREYLRIDPKGRHAAEAQASLLKSLQSTNHDARPGASEPAPPNNGAASAKRTWRNVP